MPWLLRDLFLRPENSKLWATTENVKSILCLVMTSLEHVYNNQTNTLQSSCKIRGFPQRDQRFFLSYSKQDKFNLLLTTRSGKDESGKKNMNFYCIFPSLKISIKFYSFLSAFSQIYTVREEITHTWEICHNFSISTTTLWKITQYNECNCKPYERSHKPYASLELLLSFQKQWEDDSERRKHTRNPPKRQNSEHHKNPFSTPLQTHPELSSKPHLLCKEQNSIHCALSINRPSTNIVLEFKYNPVPPTHTKILSDSVITGLSSSTCCYLHKALHSKTFKEQGRNTSYIHAISRNNLVGVECMPIEVAHWAQPSLLLALQDPSPSQSVQNLRTKPKPAVVSILH